ncbi:glutamate synthase large subunit [Actinomycetota bacterium]|nr:glutamate synthase large subunit [Actinomycetota bacterium]MDB9920648.1 glutamate synthase large subunit [Actinomycetota bacterium]
MKMAISLHPRAQGLYDPVREHDACGVAFVATLTGIPTHDIVVKALKALTNLEHRGASGSEPDSGDGAGILLQVPDLFLRKNVDFELPAAGGYAVGTAFFDQGQAALAMDALEELARSEGLTVIGWRQVPTDDSMIGATAKSCKPDFWQLFVADHLSTGIELDRAVYGFRKLAEHDLGVYFSSLSSRTLLYKGMLTTGQLSPFFPDLTDPLVHSALALVHSRFSTNTFPSWPLAHPYRLIAHNGEINTVRGNRNWMTAREAMLTSDILPGDMTRLFPICSPDASDSASFDEALELFHLGGRSLPHAVLMMIPEAWENNLDMSPARRAFYEFHATIMEPWDGPANVSFTDGTIIGAVLDRNGLRPGRFWVCDDGLVVLASEAGVLDIEPGTVVRKGRLQPGKMFLVDTAAGRVIEDEEIKESLAGEHPYQEWLARELIHLETLPEREHIVHTRDSVARRQQTFGYTQEDLRLIIEPMAKSGTEAIGSMGTDTPIAALSDRPRMLFDYFSQLFAQVTNPPLDAIREEIVTSLGSIIGPEGNLLEALPGHCRQVVLPFPVIDNDELAKILHINADGQLPEFDAARIKGLYNVYGGGVGLEKRIREIFNEVDALIRQGKRFIVLSDRESNANMAPIPSLLLCAAVHHHLVRTKNRTMISLLIETGDVREVHHVALLIGYGAAAINPYLTLESVEDLVRRNVISDITPEKAVRNVIKSLGKGLLKVMSKMGVSTVASYRGAQIFEAIGLSQEFIDAYFTGTTSQLGGVGIDVIAKENAARHADAYPVSGISPSHRTLRDGGEYQWRREGSPHLFDPETVFRLQHATRSKRLDIFREYTGRVNDQSERLMTLRGLFEFNSERPAITIDEVESIKNIVKRFSTGAMSYGSISPEAHETLAIAMNRLGAKSNTGEGGEDPERFVPMSNGDLKRSAIKQVASGRFGVTSEYLVNSDDIQIKMAQGAKPGEGGQLPGSKVYPWIAKTRHSTPGVTLISPPPHHDIYSIEDLAQLIHDLKNANSDARIHVKLVAEVGVGTVAAGVAKAHADVILISGHDGGTGASPLTSLKHAGAPWELGLAETQQTLLLNGLRDRVVLQTDGQLKTGRDVVIAALLGAEEFGFATAPLVVMGCIMMRVCHLDTCPVGVATQNPALREKFSGKPEFVETFFEYIAQEVRELLAELGFTSLDEAIGHIETLNLNKAIHHWKADGLDLEPILHVPDLQGSGHRRHMKNQEHGLEHALDQELIRMSADALESGLPTKLDVEIRNVNRTVGTMLGSEITKRGGLPDGTIDISLTGSAGQSFGAFIPQGLTLRLTGDANDYVGKGLSGGRIIVHPHRNAPFDPSENTIAGNVIGYGATSGEMFFRGRVGERFCVRNSGAQAVVEGVGDHGCEYMTGGKVVVLGPTGRNFGAGMSGGIAYVLDLDPTLINHDLVELNRLDEADSQELYKLVSAHVEHTESSRGSDLLAAWGAAVTRFTKVIPGDYKRVLEIEADALSRGEDPMLAIMSRI